jgi:hypothetical protein
MKRTHCKHGHELNEDNVYINSATGRPYCKICALARAEKWATNNPEKRRQVAKTYSKNNLEKRRGYTLAPSGFTLESFQSTLKEQNYKCAICGVPLTFEGSCWTQANADHEHVEPPKPRGVLCSSHNRMLGFAQDDPKTLEAGAAYLRKYGKS